MVKDFYRLKLFVKKIGPYNFASSSYSILIDYFGSLSYSNHPEPLLDSLLRENIKDLIGLGFKFEDYKFGFDSFKQFRRWFYHDKMLNALMNEGFVLNRYAVDSSKMFVGHTQAIAESLHLAGINPESVEMFE